MAVRNACRHCGDRHEILLFCAPARFQRVPEAIARRGLWHIRGSWRDRRIGMSDRRGAGDDSREPLILLVILAKAGIHSSASRWRQDGSRLSPGLREPGVYGVIAVGQWRGVSI